jgi:hypothetical protein
MKGFLSSLGINEEEFEWQDLSSCKEWPLDLFFELYETNKTVARQVDNLCLHCPVQSECYEFGTKGKETGVWGGFYLSNGNPDQNKNNHKSLETTKRMARRIFHESV